MNCRSKPCCFLNRKRTNQYANQYHTTFECIRQQDAAGNEFWSARTLAKVLAYSKYRHFQPIIERVRDTCLNSGHAAADHFEDILEMVDIGSGARQIENAQKKLDKKNLGKG